MEVTKENLEYAYKHTSSQWDFYWRYSNNDPRWVYNPPIEFHEGDMVYVNLDVGFPREMCFGHWCYVVKKFRDKMLVIPSTSVKDDCTVSTEMDIHVVINGKKTKSRLNFSELRTVDKMRIDPRKSVAKPQVSLCFIKYKLKEFIGG